jgi:hypothetical protein
MTEAAKWLLIEGLVPLGIAALGGAFVAMLSRHHAA